MCYRLKASEECKTYISNSLLHCNIYKEQKTRHRDVLTNLNNLEEQANVLTSLATRDLHKKYKCKIHLQACLIYSEQEK